MVDAAFNFLYLISIFITKRRRYIFQGFFIFRSQLLTGNDSCFNQGDEIFDFNLASVLHQGGFGEEWIQVFDLFRVAAVNGRNVVKHRGKGTVREVLFFIKKKNNASTFDQQPTTWLKTRFSGVAL